MRDYRDAKAMAHTLRAGLTAMSFKISVSQSLELIAQAFGVADWNTLSAATRSAPAAVPWSACSFCGKSRHEVRSLVGGCGGWEAFRASRGPERSSVFICDECVVFCAQTDADRLAASSCKTTERGTNDHEPQRQG